MVAELSELEDEGDWSDAAWEEENWSADLEEPKSAPSETQETSEAQADEVADGTWLLANKKIGTDSNGEEFFFEYNENGLVSKETYVYNAEGERYEYQVIYEYDEYDGVERTVGWDDEGTVTVTKEFNSDGTIKSSTTVYDDDEEDANFTEYEYEDGKPVTETLDGELWSEYEYDGDRLSAIDLMDDAGTKKQYFYDANGNI